MSLRDKIYNAGIVGAGGAGFPTHFKLKSKVEYLIVNAAECEPLIQTDKYLMRTKGIEIIKVMEEVAKIIGARKSVLGLKRKYKQEIDSLSDAIKQLDSKVELFYLDNFYPAGDEQILVYEVLKKSIPPAGIPLNVGAVVINVGTIVNIYDAMEDKPVVNKYLSVVGNVKNPTLLKAPIGTSIAKCIKEAGGVNIERFCVIMGGPMMGKIITQDEIQDNVITKTDGSLIIIPYDHYLVQKRDTPMDHIINRARSACIQCSYCTNMCPRYLIGHTLRPHKIMRNIGRSVVGDENFKEFFKEALLCSECGVCELYACPMGLSPRQVNISLKNKLREMGTRYENNESHIIALDSREYRKVPVPRLMSRINISQYAKQNVGELKEIEVSKVSIPLKQHIGKPAQPVVGIGDKVEIGQLIGKVEEGDIGANIHASIKGKVSEVSDKIIIQTDNSEVIS